MTILEQLSFWPDRSDLAVTRDNIAQQSVPKRTNDFQALIALVERQLAASGVRVVESEMLADRLTGELREVNVCDSTQGLRSVFTPSGTLNMMRILKRMRLDAGS